MSTKEREPAKFMLLNQRCASVDILLMHVRHLAERDRQMTISKEGSEYVISYNSGPSERKREPNERE